MQDTSYLTVRRFLDLPRQKLVLRKRWSRLIILLITYIFILLWQINFATKANMLDESYRITRVTGSQHEDVVEFTYFLYYSNLFPIFSTVIPKPLNKEGARYILDNYGNTLYMDSLHWALRFGHLGRGYIYLLDAVIKGKPKDLSAHTTHGTAFVIALLAVYFAFWWAEFPLFGLLIVLLAGSNPFQLYEVYNNENVFSWMITTAILVLAINLPLISKKKPPLYWFFVAPILSGFFLGAVNHIRTEPVSIILSAAFVYLTVTDTQWQKRLIMLFLLVFSFLSTNMGIQRYFEYKIDEAVAILKKVGGYPLGNHLRTSHGFWHPLWCGLGDFDDKYGYSWHDQTAYQYAEPILKEKYNLKKNILHENVYLDKANKYPMKIENLQQYRAIMRDKVLSDITQDPLWYLEIIGKRIIRVFTMTTPVRLALGAHSLDLPLPAVLIIPSLILLAYFRAWFFVKLLCFTFPLSLTSIIMFSGNGITYYNCFHLFNAAIMLAILFEGILWFWQRKMTVKTNKHS